MVFTPIKDCACVYCVQNIPTIREFSPFDPEADATTLKDAMKGWGCSNEEITKIMGNRTASQRELIEECYKNLFGKDLQDDLKSELGGNFERLVIALMTPWPHLMARNVKKAMKGMGTDEGQLIDILCAANNCQIKMITEAYKEMDGDSLEEDLDKEVGGDFKNLLIALCQAKRHEDDAVDMGRAKEDAAKLLEAGEMKVGTDESAFTSVLVRNSYAQLDATSKAYEELAGKTLEEVVDAELGGDLKQACQTILAVGKNKDAFWANKLHNSMAGFGTDDKDLINIIVLRSEIDLGNIMKEYEKLFGKSLHDSIEDEASGDYKKLLLDIID